MARHYLDTDRGSADLETERMLRLMEETAAAANLASSSGEAIQETLERVCTALGWPVGHGFVVDPKGERWNEVGAWHISDPDRFGSFRAHTESMTFALDQGLPGRVLDLRAANWIPDISKESLVVRREQIREAGLRASMAFPVMVRDEVVAVLEFFSPEVTEKDDLILEVMGYLGLQLGRVFEREQADTALEQMLEDLPVAIYRAEAGALGRWTYVTSRVEELLGVQPEALLRDPQEWLNRIHEDDRDRVIAEEDAAVLGAEPGSAFISEYRVVRPSGDIVWIQDEATVFFDDGDCLLQGVLLDITSRKEAEEEKRNVQERFQALVQNSQDVIALVDEEGRFKYISPAITRLTGYQPQELLGRSAFDFAPPEDHQEAVTSFREFGRSGAGAEAIEVHAEHRDGRRIWIEMRAVDRLDDPAIRGIVLNYHDITERKTHEKFQSDLRQAQKMEAVGRLAGGIAHDFNNILAVIGNYAGFLREDLARDDPRLPDVIEIERAVDRAATMIRQLLAFSRKEVTRPEVLDMNNVVAGLQRILQRAVGEDVEFSFNPARDLWMIEADRGQMEQVLMNLVVNARDAMTHGGRLSIETSNVVVDEALTSIHEGLRSGPCVRIDVSDTGSGMSEEVSSQIFEPFFTTKERGEGTGLGLATVYGIVKQSNGYISVYSEPALGTTFRLFLPVSAKAAPTPEQVRLPEPIPGGGGRVLVVEDDLSVRAVVERILTRGGYRIVVAASGAEALELLRDDVGVIDLLVTDVIMPGMSGKDLAAEIQELRPAVRTLYMSGYTGDIIAKRGILDADAELIQKPFTGAQLLERVQSILQEGD
jgi:PAS domain S-box-containing protein